MGTIPFQDRLVGISRLTTDSDNSNKEGYVVNLAMQNIKMNIQPASNEDTIMVEGVFAQTYKGFTTSSGIQTGDLVTVSGTGSKYVIKGVQDWDFDPLPHYELLLTQPTNF